MKRILAVVMLFSISRLVAQTPEPVSPEPPAKKAPRVANVRNSGYRSGSAFSPIFSFARYGLDGDFTSGFALGLAYSPNRRTNPQIELSGGVVLGRRGLAGEFVYSPPLFLQKGHPDFAYGGRYYAVPLYKLELGFLGLGSVIYLADGDVRPYIGAGLHLYGWQFQSSLAGTVTPEVKAGLDMTLSSGVSGFIEVRHAVGMPNLLSSQRSTFDGLTSFGIGFAFVPRF
jgi:opacity protein-like surface antigen